VRVAIVYDSATGTTKAAAEHMAEAVVSAGHECTAQSVEAADPEVVTAADAIVVGSWTTGLFVILQKPTEATMAFIDNLGHLDGKPAAVFTTYKLAVGGMLTKMASRMEARGANVTGLYKSRGPHAAEGFGDWVRALGTDT